MIEWNKVIYADCMNEVNGLPTLPNKSVDLCITDPPFNVKFKGQGSNKKEFTYNDYKLDYKKWCESWFKQLKRICKVIMITPGNPNISMWVYIEEPKEFFFHYKPDGQGRTCYSQMIKGETILAWGDLPTTLPFVSNVFKHYVQKKHLDVIHPCPRPISLWEEIIKRLHRKGFNSVIDIFMGSGTTAIVCKKLGIKWLGYEINEVYSQDINKRLKNCVREPNQVVLGAFL